MWVRGSVHQMGVQTPDPPRKGALLRGTTAAKNDKTAMRPFAKLCWILVVKSIAINTAILFTTVVLLTISPVQSVSDSLLAASFKCMRAVSAAYLQFSCR